jgi:hypothetical protein
MQLLVGLKFFELLLPDQIALFVQQTSSQLTDVSTVVRTLFVTVHVAQLDCTMRTMLAGLGSLHRVR